MTKLTFSVLLLLLSANLQATEMEVEKSAREAFEAAPPSEVSDFAGIYYGYCYYLRPGTLFYTEMYLLKDAKGGTHQRYLLGIIGPKACVVDDDYLDRQSQRMQWDLESTPQLKLVGGEVQTSGDHGTPLKHWVVTFRKNLDSISLKMEEEASPIAYCYFDCRVR